jgi:hypothetical protein
MLCDAIDKGIRIHAVDVGQVSSPPARHELCPTRSGLYFVAKESFSLRSGLFLRGGKHRKTNAPAGIKIFQPGRDQPRSSFEGT